MEGKKNTAPVEAGRRRLKYLLQNNFPDIKAEITLMFSRPDPLPLETDKVRA